MPPRDDNIAAEYTLTATPSVTLSLKLQEAKPPRMWRLLPAMRDGRQSGLVGEGNDAARL